jgi:hypothetical protein
LAALTLRDKNRALDSDMALLNNPYSAEAEIVFSGPARGSGRRHTYD